MKIKSAWKWILVALVLGAVIYSAKWIFDGQGIQEENSYKPTGQIAKD